MGQNCLKIFEFLTPKNNKKSRKKNREKLIKIKGPRVKSDFYPTIIPRCNFIASHTQWLMGFLTFGCMSNNVTHMCVAYSSELYIIWYLSWVYIISYCFNVRSMSCWICFEYLLIFIFNRSWIIYPIGML